PSELKSDLRALSDPDVRNNTGVLLKGDPLSCQNVPEAEALCLKAFSPAHAAQPSPFLEPLRRRSHRPSAILEGRGRLRPTDRPCWRASRGRGGREREERAVPGR